MYRVILGILGHNGYIEVGHLRLSQVILGILEQL